MVGVMKMAKMVVVIAGEGASSSGRVKILDLENVTLQAKTQKLKTALEQSEEKFHEKRES